MLAIVEKKVFPVTWFEDSYEYDKWRRGKVIVDRSSEPKDWGWRGCLNEESNKIFSENRIQLYEPVYEENPYHDIWSRWDTIPVSALSVRDVVSDKNNIRF